MPIAGVFIGTLPRKNMRGNAVKEHTVVAGYYCAAGERQQRFFETFERFYVQVVRGLIEQEQVAPLLQRKSEVQTIALTARKNAGRLLLVRALKAEVRHICTAGNLGFTYTDIIQPVGNHFPKRLFRVKTFTILVNVGNLYGFAQLKRAARNRLFTHNHLEQG